jgi:hypothetical protein
MILLAGNTVLQVLQEVWTFVCEQYTTSSSTAAGSQGPATSLDNPQQLLADRWVSCFCWLACNTCMVTALSAWLLMRLFGNTSWQACNLLLWTAAHCFPFCPRPHMTASACQHARPTLCCCCSAGYAACCILRQTIGMHHYAPVEGLADPRQRAACQAAHLAAGHRLLLGRNRLGSIQQLVHLVEKYC